MTDPRSRLHQLAIRIEREQLRVQFPHLPAWAWRTRRLAARYLALAEMVMDQIGTDEKATPRRLTGLQKAAQVEIRKLRALTTSTTGHTSGPSIAEIRARYQVNGRTAPDEVVAP